MSVDWNHLQGEDGSLRGMPEGVTSLTARSIQFYVIFVFTFLSRLFVEMPMDDEALVPDVFRAPAPRPRRHNIRKERTIPHERARKRVRGIKQNELSNTDEMVNASL
jgi:hypothetical protein